MPTPQDPGFRRKRSLSFALKDTTDRPPRWTERWVPASVAGSWGLSNKRFDERKCNTQLFKKPHHRHPPSQKPRPNSSVGWGWGGVGARGEEG